jgi:hypothetical protein
MTMLSHSDPGVKHQALLCIQKLMVHHWEYLVKIDPGNTGSSTATTTTAPSTSTTNKTVETKA